LISKGNTLYLKYLITQQEWTQLEIPPKCRIKRLQAMNVDLFLITEEGDLVFHSKGKGFIPVPTPNRLPVIQISAVTQAALVLVGTFFLLPDVF